MNMLKSACLSRNWCLYLHLCLTVLQYMIFEKLSVTFLEPLLNDSLFSERI